MFFCALLQRHNSLLTSYVHVSLFYKDRDRSFSTETKFSENLHLLVPDIYLRLCVSGGEKY